MQMDKRRLNGKIVFGAGLVLAALLSSVFWGRKTEDAESSLRAYSSEQPAPEEPSGKTESPETEPRTVSVSKTAAETQPASAEAAAEETTAAAAYTQESTEETSEETPEESSGEKSQDENEPADRYAYLNERLYDVDYDAVIAAAGEGAGDEIAGAWEIAQNGGFVRKNEDRKVIYLTFCMGVEYGETEAILNILQEKNVKAAFFVVGTEYLRPENAYLVRRIVNEGHILGCHGYTHTDTRSCSSVRLINEVLAWNDAASSILGYSYSARFYKPPFARHRSRALGLCHALGLTPVGHSFTYSDYDDNAFLPAETAMENLLRGLSCGAVYYLHATRSNAAALSDFIDAAKATGYAVLGFYEPVPEEAPVPTEAIEETTGAAEESSGESETEEQTEASSEAETCGEAAETEAETEGPAEESLEAAAEESKSGQETEAFAEESAESLPAAESEEPGKTEEPQP